MMVSILMLGWNSGHYVSECLQSLRDRISIPFEVIFVDNNSTDGTADLVAEKFPWVNLIRSEDNLGFTRGTNLAAKHASGQYFLLLNVDTVLQTDISDCVSALAADESLGAVGAAMYGGKGEPRHACARFPTPMRLWRFASLLYTSETPYPAPGNIRLSRCDFVEGSFLMLRADRWRQLGGLDENYYMYGEDIDLCRRLLDLGLVTVQCPSVRYTHYGGYNHARMGYLFGGYRRYHRKFSSRAVQVEADFVLRVGFLLRLPWYWFRAISKGDSVSRSALDNAIKLNRNWSDTLKTAHRFHS